ncbi:MAG: hypothetical protein TREMPRED_000943 [Tremellales sp. Tagirdzhanova-0007]|nr:MAG: hypothetical protein TREMPRED_000943 [Tremellales sp. Tagirdzhanova-0007]
MIAQTSRRNLLFVLGLAFALILLASLAYHSSTLLPIINRFSQSPTSTTSGSSRIRDGPITYIPFTFGWAMLLQTLRGYQISDWPNLVIVDNSWDGYAYEEKDMLRDMYGVIDVIPTPVRLRFAQIQAFMDKIAADSVAPMYFWSHTDILLVPNGPDTYGRAMDAVHRWDINGTLGVLHFAYDLLSAVTAKAGKIAPWDPAMPQYGSDCDRYMRLKLAGMHATDNGERIAEIIHLHSVLSEDEMERLYDDTEDVQERVRIVRELNDAREQYAWRYGGEGDGREGITEMDVKAKYAEEQGGRLYFEAKWGQIEELCELDDRTPAFDLASYVDTKDRR